MSQIYLVHVCTLRFVLQVRSTEASIALPNYEACRKVVKRQRKDDANMSDTTSLSEVKTSKGHPFLLWDSSNDNEESRILMFGTQENLNLLNEFKNWSADGTFNVVPQAIFTQLFTIHIIVERKAIPMLFILLENKQGGTYLRVFQKLKELNPNLSPNSILVDFELACFTKIKEVFPQADIVGCFFHLTQSLWRNIQRLGLVNIYKTSEKFRLNCKMLAALAYVPPKDVQFALEIISENFDEEMRPLVDYWERIYVGKRIEHVAPKFNIDMWNAFDRTINGLPITNNSLEAWHLSFQQSLGCFNPSLNKLLQQMKKEQDTTETYILKYRAGFRQSNATHSKYYQKCKRIRQLLNDYVFRNVENHLRAVAYNLSF